MWLIRSVLEIARAGQPAGAAGGGTACISRAHAFALQDPDSGSYSTHSTSGLIMSSGYFGNRRKPSYYYYSAYNSWLGNHSYAGPVALPSGTSASVRALCFVKRAPALRYAIVIWATTSAASVFPGVVVNLSSAACPVVPAAGGSAVLVTPTAGVIGGGVAAIAGTSVTLSVTEVPVIIALA